MSSYLIKFNYIFFLPPSNPPTTHIFLNTFAAMNTINGTKVLRCLKIKEERRRPFNFIVMRTTMESEV